MAITPIYNPAPDDPTADTLYQTGNKINNNEAFLDAKIDDEITNRTNAVALKADIASPAFTGNPTAPTPTVGDDDTSIATTAFVQNELALKPNRNLIINGDFSVWQRGTSASITSTGLVYNSADRWRFYYADTTITKTAQVYNGTRINAMQIAYSGSTGVADTSQTIENASSALSGRDVTVSFIGAVTSGTTIYKVRLELFDGSGTSQYSSDQNITFTGSSAKYEVTFSVTDESAHDITSGNVRLNIFGVSAGASTLLLSNVQVEVASKATEFEVLDPATQLARCQRYFYKAYTSIYLASGGPSDTEVYPNIDFPVTMRTTPGISYGAVNWTPVTLYNRPEGLYGYGSYGGTGTAIITNLKADAEI